MDFWSVFFDESLQSPWVIEPKKVADVQGETGVLVSTPYAFVFSGDPDQTTSVMLSKMVLAIKLSPEEVTLAEWDGEEMNELKMVGEPKKILFFGSHFPGSFGQVRNWYGHQVIQTHSLSQLVSSPDLKKETWFHLKKFASLR